MTAKEYLVNELGIGFYQDKTEQECVQIIIDSHRRIRDNAIHYQEMIKNIPCNNCGLVKKFLCRNKRR